MLGAGFGPDPPERFSPDGAGGGGKSRKWVQRGGGGVAFSGVRALRCPCLPSSRGGVAVHGLTSQFIPNGATDTRVVSVLPKVHTPATRSSAAPSATSASLTPGQHSGTVRQLRHYFGPMSHAHFQAHHPHAPCDVIYVVLMLIGCWLCTGWCLQSDGLFMSSGRTHEDAGEKPFGCSFVGCGRRFSTKGEIVPHEEAHARGTNR